MMFDSWHASTIDRVVLQRALLKFLRTHDDAGARLIEWMKSVPIDHTEAQYDRDYRARSLLSVTNISEHDNG